MNKIAIIYHSGYGHTEKLARHVFQGVESESNVKVEIFKTSEIEKKLDILQDFDAIIFGSPTYMGSVSADFKKFMDATSSIWIKQEWKDKIAAGFTNSHSLSGDKLNTLIQMNIFAMQHGMIWVGLGHLNGSPENQSGEKSSINRIGSFIGAMAQSENLPPEQTPPQGDLDTGFHLGKRVAQITKKFNQ